MKVNLILEMNQMELNLVRRIDQLINLANQINQNNQVDVANTSYIFTHTMTHKPMTHTQPMTHC